MDENGQQTLSGLEKAEKEGDLSDDSSSIFSWHHSEGPRSLRRSTTSGTTTGRLERPISNAGSALPRLGRTATQQAFSHPLTNEQTKANVLVDFEGPDDPYRAMNWPVKKKVTTTIIFGLLALTTSFSTSVYAPAVDQVSEEFGVGTEVALLGVSTLLFGMGIGPLLWGPLSEVYGRKYIGIFPVFISAMFTFGGGAAKDIQTIIICRFFMGFFGSAPVTNTGGVLGDLWAPKQRGVAMVGYSLSVVGGPTVGPLVGAALTGSYLGWRWTQYITGIFQCFIVVIGFIFLEECYPPTLLMYKANRLRHESGNWALHAEREEWDVSPREMAHKYLIRPIRILCTPIGGLMVFYASFCYALIYACFAAFPIVFEQGYGWTPVVGSLPFLAELIGVSVGGAINVANNGNYGRKLAANNGRPVPEARLPPMMLGSPLLAAGIFLLAWTAEYKVFWFVPCIGVFLLGTGFFTIFQGALNYMIDTFTMFSASAVAANTFVRSMLGGAFPLFITYELNAIGVGWGLSVFGFVATVLIPVPYVFYTYGKRIREMSPVVE